MAMMNTPFFDHVRLIIHEPTQDETPTRYPQTCAGASQEEAGSLPSLCTYVPHFFRTKNTKEQRKERKKTASREVP
jgi:hypothetical protein